jgi:hypothetical protein
MTGDSGGFSITKAYVDIATRGDVKEDLRKQVHESKRFEEQMKQLELDRRRGTADRVRHERMIETIAQKPGRDRKQVEADIGRGTRQRQQAETAIEQRRSQIEQKEKESLMFKKANAFLLVDAIHKAAGSLPGVGGMAAVAQAGIAGMGRGGGAMLAGAGLTAAASVADYGFKGSQIASPAAFERLQHQSDRLQAIIGQGFTPMVRTTANVFEKLADLIGGTGAQLNHPKFSNFADIRDRLQIAGLEGMPGGGRPSVGQSAITGGLLGTAAGMLVPGGGLTMLGAGISAGYRSIMNALS